jgi:hypothetical protein
VPVHPQVLCAKDKVEESKQAAERKESFKKRKKTDLQDF